MSTLHPHWQATDDGEQPVTIRIVDSAQKQGTSVPRAKRKPAAFVGIVLFVGLGFVFFQGMNGLLGQTATAETDETVRISDAGFDPEEVTISPGETIEWVNESTVPHLLTSETLMIEDDEPFETPIILPQESYKWTIPMDVELGEYEYTSKIAPAAKGTMIIELETVAVASSSQALSVAAASSVAFSAAAIPEVPSQPTYVPPAQSPDDVGADMVQPGTIPQNPYAVGGEVPAPSYTNPNTSIPTTTPVQGSVTQHKPTSQPSTGMGAWTLAILGVAALLILMRWTRKSF